MILKVQVLNDNGEIVYSKDFDTQIDMRTSGNVTIDGEIDSILQGVQEALAEAADLDER